MPSPGDLVAGKYLVVRVIGEGGMGVVYEATHQRLRQRVALKMLLPAMLEYAVVVSRFEREARAAAQLRGRHVARVVDVDLTPDGLPYMVMDFLEGHDLQAEIERRGRLESGPAVDYVLQACAAMIEAHQIGIVHRDLKPSNLFLAEDEALGRVVKVLDFGISKLAADADAKLTDVDTVMGTALYMSPEQLRASHAVDARTDIWALGVILYEAVTGRVPFLGPPQQVAAQIVTEEIPDVRLLCPELPPELAAVIHHALQRDPGMRHQDVRQLAGALAPFAPPGSVGRNFADNLGGAGSSPRISVPRVSVADSSPAIPAPAGGGAGQDRTVLHARGVGEERLRIADGASHPEGWLEPPPSKSRAILLGLILAFAITLLSITGVLVFVQRSSRGVPAPVTPGTGVSARGSETAILAGSSPAPATSAVAEPPSAPSAAAPASPTPAIAPLAGGSAKAVKPASVPKPRASSSAKPAPTGEDKPLFL
jgi:serine/threonine protein kinase